MFSLYDVVMTTIDIPHERLPKGSIGTIVHIHSRGVAYEVEFISPTTELTTHVLSLLPEYITPAN